MYGALYCCGRRSERCGSLGAQYICIYIILYYIYIYIDISLSLSRSLCVCVKCRMSLLTLINGSSKSALCSEFAHSCFVARFCWSVGSLRVVLGDVQLEMPGGCIDSLRLELCSDTFSLCESGPGFDP